jgi:hypothetical protein
MVDAADAPGITIPFAMLPSKDEPKEVRFQIPALVFPHPKLY